MCLLPANEWKPPTSQCLPAHLIKHWLTTKSSPMKAERMKRAVSFLKDIPCKVHTSCPLIFYWPELSHVASTASGAGSLLLGTISAERAACPGHEGRSFLLFQPMAPSRQRYKNKWEKTAVPLLWLAPPRPPAGPPHNPNLFPSQLPLNSSQDLANGAGFSEWFHWGWGWNLVSGVEHAQCIFDKKPIFRAPLTFMVKSRSHPAMLLPLSPCFLSLSRPS